MTRTIRGRDLLAGDKVVRFTNDADVIVTNVEATASSDGDIMLTLDVVDHGGDRVVGQTYFIAHPDTAYTIDRP